MQPSEAVLYWRLRAATAMVVYDSPNVDNSLLAYNHKTCPGSTLVVFSQFLATSAGIWQSDYRQVGGWAGGRKETAMSEPVNIFELESRNLSDIIIAHPLWFMCADFRDHIRIKSMSREATPIRNGIFALMRPPPAHCWSDVLLVC
jgi:hypothetical protein